MRGKWPAATGRMKACLQRDVKDIDDGVGVALKDVYDGQLPAGRQQGTEPCHSGHARERMPA